MAIEITRTDGGDDGAIITIPIEDGSQVLIQDVYNAIRDFEANPANMDMLPLCQPKTAGKADLGGGSFTAITLQFINRTLLSFEARAGPAVIACVVRGGDLTASNTWTGTVTSNDAGTTLTDTAATLAAYGIQTDEAVRNVDDNSTATVTTVDSETVITHSALAGGSENDWDIGEVWEIDSAHPIQPTANVHVTIAQDSAPVTIDTSSLISDLGSSAWDQFFPLPLQAYQRSPR